MTRRRLSQIAAGGAAGTAIAACDVTGGGSPESQPGPTSASAKLPAEMTWMGWSMGQEFLLPAYEETAAGFGEQHPESKLVLSPAGGGYREKYTTLVAAGTPPDVADVHWQQHVRDVGPNGLTMDLTPFLKKDAYPKD
ncbi:MAG: extracellular solute-binding protein, partial [Chloroflexota bacterium]